MYANVLLILTIKWNTKPFGFQVHVILDSHSGGNANPLSKQTEGNSKLYGTDTTKISGSLYEQHLA